MHKDRPSHGFVLNAGDSEKTYVFSDGREMKTAEKEYLLLKKQMVQYVKSILRRQNNETI